jgi:hypothetical protein
MLQAQAAQLNGMSMEIARLSEWRIAVDRRLGKLETAIGDLPKRKQDDGKSEITVKVVLEWAWRFMLAGAALAGAFNLEKLAELFK